MSLEIEQQQELTPIETPAPAGPVTRDDLIAAAAAAREANGPDVIPEPGTPAPDGTPAETPATPAAPAEPNRLEAMMKLRESRHAETEAQRSSARRIEEEAQERSRRVIADAEAKAAKLIEDTVAQHRAQFAASPVAALRALGLDSQEAIDAVLRENTPQAKALADITRKLSATEAETKATKSAVEELAQYKREVEQQQQQAAVDAYNRQYLATDATKEAAPYMHARWEPEQIIAESRAQADRWHKEGLKYGIDFDDKLIVAYLEDQSKKRYSGIASQTPAAPQVSVAAPLQAPGSAPKVQANGPRTLSAAQGSERRSAPKPFHQLTPAQKREALIEEAAAARRLHPDSEG